MTIMERLLPKFVINTHLRSRLFIITAALFWSLSGACAKWIGLPGPIMAFYRALFASLFLIPFLKKDFFKWNSWMLVMVIAFSIMNVSFVSALTLTSSANSILLQYTAPIWMIFLSYFFLKESIDKKSLQSFILAGIGILIILSSGGEPKDIHGMLLALLAGLSYAFVAVSLRRLNKFSGIFLTWLNLTLSALLLLPLLGWEQISTSLSSFQYLQLFIFGSLQMAIPYVLFAQGLKNISAQEAGVLSLLEVIGNPLFSYLLMNETIPSSETFIGGGFVLFGILIRILK